MNKIYNIIWSKTLSQWVVAPETARSSSTGKSRTIAAIIASMFVHGAALAANECGVVAAGDSVLCTPNDYTPTANGNITYTNINGLTLTPIGFTLTLPATVNNQQGVLVSTGAANTTFSGAINIASNLDIQTGDVSNIGTVQTNTSGRYGDGVRAQNYGTGDTSASLQGGWSVTTYGYNAHGIYAWQRGANAANTANVSALSSGNITTHGRYSAGLHARSDTGQGHVSATLNNGNITTYGRDAPGVIVNNSAGIAGAAGQSSITMASGTIETAGIGSHGIEIDHGTKGNASVVVNNGTINTKGADAHAVLISSKTGNAEITSAGILSTTGNNAEGLYVLSDGSNVTLAATQSGGSISTAGVDADGIVVYANSTTATGVTANATQSGGTITTTGGATTTFGIPSNGSAGMIAQVAGSGLAQTTQSAGSINTSGVLGFGMVALNSGTGDATTTQAGTVITTGELAQGVYASANAGNAVVNSSGTVSTAGKSAAGILAVASDDITINQTGSITTTGVGQSVYLPIILATAGVSSPDTGNADGILAFSSEGSVTINSANINAAGDGIDGNTAEANMTITTTGILTAGEEGIDAEIDDADGAVLRLNNNAILTAAGTGILASSDGGTSIINNTNSITSNDSDGINVVNVSDGSTITNSGDITATTTDKFVIAGGDAIEIVTTSAGVLTGNTDLGAGNDSFTASGGALVGNTLMGDGDDVATLTGTVDVTSAPQFDGGAGTDALNVDGLTLRGFTAASNDGTGNLTETNNSNLTGWETINVKNTGTLKLSNNLFTAANIGTLNIDATSTLDLKGNSPGVFTIFGDVNNSGLMTMADGAADDVTTITGNYTGVAGSQYNIDTVLGNDASATDKLIVNGNTAGATTLSVTNVGGAGAQTVEGIQVVQVDGTSDGAFSLTAPVQAGSYEYTLQKNGVSTPTDGDWYLRSTFVPTCDNTPSLCPVEPEPPVSIYRPAVSMYVTAQSANADAGFLQLSTLHQRMGEQRGLSTDKAQIWGRIFTAAQNNSGQARFNYEQNTTGFQFGRDLLHKTDAQGKQQRAGLTMQYAHSSIDSEDVIRPRVGLGKDTGSTSATSVGIGGYFTQIAKDGTYIDIVSQVNRLTNKFSDSYGMKSKQRGWQLGLSGEVGKPVAQVKGWNIEPQAQLSYLYSRYSDFSDLYSNIDGVNTHNLKARLGLRVHKDVVIDNKDAQYYGIANIHHDLLKPKTIILHDRTGTGQASVNERFDRTSWELGAGIQGQVGKNTYLYADARYERSFKGNKEAGKINFGVKASF